MDPTAFRPDWTLIAVVVGIFAIVAIVAWLWVAALGQTGSNDQAKPKIDGRVKGPHDPESAAYCLADLQRRRESLTRSVKKTKRGRTAEDWTHE